MKPLISVLSVTVDFSSLCIYSHFETGYHYVALAGLVCIM